MPKRKGERKQHQQQPSTCACTFENPEPLKAKNALQQHYIDCINESPITIATGYPGTGKTYLPARIAANLLKTNAIKNITLTRPNVSSSKTMGHYPGSKNEKMQQWLAPVLNALKEEFSTRTLAIMTNPDYNLLTMCPMELIKGLSWDNTFIIVDEAEDLTIAEIRAVLTRIGTNSKIVLCGDIQQTDIKNSGLSILLRMRENDRRLQNLIGYVDFNDASNIVRSVACREIILGFERANL